MVTVTIDSESQGIFLNPRLLKTHENHDEQPLTVTVTVTEYLF
jgi:hypothetical protein